METTNSQELQLSLVSPSGILYQGSVSNVHIPANDGMMGVLSGHAPFVGLLGNGLMTCYPIDGRVERFILEGGFLEISHNRVAVVANKAERLSDVQVEEATRELMELQKGPVAGDEAIERRLDRQEAARVRIRYGSGPRA